MMKTHLIIVKLKYFFFAFIAGVLAGCVNPPEYPVEPEITFVSFSKDIVAQREEFEIRFEFKDGDGDLGFQDRDTIKEKCNPCEIDSCVQFSNFSVFLLDQRIGCIEHFLFPYVPPKGSSDDISGRVYISVTSCCIFPDNTICRTDPVYLRDTVNYTLFIKDRAGNVSNKLQLPPLIIRCDSIASL